MGKARKIKAAVRQALAEQLMADSLFDEQFVLWPVFEGEYKWEDSRVGRVIVQSVPIYPNSVESYNPLEVSGLFRVFAEVPQTEEGCRLFANKYGLLESMAEGHEAFWEWCEAIETMNLAVFMWDQVAAGTVSKDLRVPTGTRHHPNRPYMKTPGDLSFLHKPSLMEKRFKSHLEEGDAVSAARETLALAINLGLQFDTTVSIAWNSRRSKHIIRVRPRTLLGCMWWQLARLFLGQVEYGACRVCGKPIERGKGAFMATREFCSPACKQKDHRSRVKLAKELKGSGMSIARIAKKLKTEPDVITNWLNKKK